MINLDVFLRHRPLAMLEDMYRTLTDEPNKPSGKRVPRQIVPKNQLFISELPVGRANLVAAMKQLLVDPVTLLKLYLDLTPFDKMIISSIVNSNSNLLNESAVFTQYGHLRTKAPSKIPVGMLPGLTVLMTASAIMAEETATVFRKHLKNKIKPLVAFELRIQEELPTSLNDPDIEVNYIIHEYECEQTALVDIKSVLLAAESGKIMASATTGVVTKTGAGIIRNVLSGGDFYPTDLKPEDPIECTIGDKGIKAYSWALLLQEAKLATANSKKLRLTTDGKKALQQRPERVVKRVWNAWLKSTNHSEGHRIELIKGTKRRGMIHPPSESRKGLAKVLKSLPVGDWVNIFDFLEYMMVTNPVPINTCRHDFFDTVRAKYGNFGSDPLTPIFENRFIFAFLIEYAACLGVIDIALTQPWGVSSDLDEVWGFEEVTAISRYDGLQFIRLTPLGNWVLGNTKQYTPVKSQEENTIRVLPNLDIVVTAEKHPASVEILLKQLCEPSSARVKKLSTNIVLNSISSGIRLSHLRDKLNLFSENELPGTVIAFFEDIDRRANLLKPAGEAKLIECYDEATALLIANNKKLKKYCMLAGTKHLAVLHKDATKFMNALRKEGMTLPASFAD